MKAKELQPDAILHQLRGYVTYVGCCCGNNDKRHRTYCARAHFASLLRKLGAALKKGRTR